MNKLWTRPGTKLSQVSKIH